MNGMNLNKKQIIMIVSTFVLLAGIIFGVYLVQIKQTFKPKADNYGQLYNGFTVKQSDGKILTRDEDQYFQTDSVDLEITVDKDFLDSLVK